MSHARSNLTLIDLFCGAGGLSEGLRQAGFSPLVGVDSDLRALATYTANHTNSKPLLADIATVTGRRLLKLAGTDEIDLLAGGPSCQGFSTHGKRIEDDPRNFLFKEFVRLVKEVQPKFFLMENVKGLLVYSKGRFKHLIEEAFARIGYRVVSSTLCAADYGVPQLRHRVMFIGTRLSDVDLSFPVPTHGEDQSDLICRGLLPYVTVAEAIDDLPGLLHKKATDQCAYAAGPSNSFQQYARAMSGDAVTLHTARRLSPQAARIASFVGQGQGLRAVPVQHLPERFQKMRRISTGALRRDCTTLYYRLHPDRPAYTITCYYTNVASGPFLHPWEDRSLSHREAARLMSFPDHFEFLGPGWPRQIGNAVPPLMAAAAGRHIAKLLSRTETPRRRAA
jgi:DNA (cytosine-5)-methyltransferase 1